MNALKRVGNYLAPKAEKSDDGRDKWGSRTSFVLAAMGGAVGLGNLLRFPSIAFNNNGVQFFIPYFLAIAFLGIPVLILEICIGQAYRGGCVIAYDHISKRTKGVGLAVIFNGYAIAIYYIPILAYVMEYFRNSFISPLPWTGRIQEFYMGDVVANVDPIPGSFNSDGSVASYVSYPGTGMNAETVGWCAFTWFVIWLCVFRGVGLTGRVVYFTMGLPVVVLIILLGRAASLPNSLDGVRLYVGTWHGGKLGSSTIWQDALGQVFFSIGIGMGYFTSYASYNSKYSNAVQDALIICCCNSLYEIISGFVVFSVVGFIGLIPGETRLSTFTVGFLTYPAAITEMPGSNFWAVAFFFTLQMLGFSSGFALIESLVTMIMDTRVGRKFPRPMVATIVVIVSFLLSLMYCTEFGFYMLDAVDTWMNYLSLFFVVWFECVVVTVVYRYKDVINQTGLPSLIVYNIGYIGGQIFGIACGHATKMPAAGAGLGFGLWLICTITAIFLARTPNVVAPRFWGRNNLLNRFWWLAFYSGHQLSQDLNTTVAHGKNWAIPSFWAPILRYATAPILGIVYSFAYPSFYKVRNDPLHIFGFTIAHLGMVWISLGFLLPRMYDVFIPPEHKTVRHPDTIPREKIEGVAERMRVGRMEGGEGNGVVGNESSEEQEMDISRQTQREKSVL